MLCFSNTSIEEGCCSGLFVTGILCGNYDHKAPAELPMEMQDTYVRLDNSIAELLELIDRKVGLNNTLFFITSTGYADADPVDPPQYKIPGGEFHIERCSALLNLYLVCYLR